MPGLLHARLSVTPVALLLLATGASAFISSDYEQSRLACRDGEEGVPVNLIPTIDTYSEELQTTVAAEM